MSTRTVWQDLLMVRNHQILSWVDEICRIITYNLPIIQDLVLSGQNSFSVNLVAKNWRFIGKIYKNCNWEKSFSVRFVDEKAT